MMVLK